MKWIRPILPMLLFLLCADLGWTQAQEASVVRDPPPPYLPDPNNQFDLTTATAVAKGHPWLELPPVDYQPPPYARYLRGLRICLDPGHGGYQHVKGYKATASGYEEAVMNLAVAKHLRDWLLKSGVTVVMTTPTRARTPISPRPFTTPTRGPSTQTWTLEKPSSTNLNTGCDFRNMPTADCIRIT
jgi:hypothetical protein